MYRIYEFEALVPEGGALGYGVLVEFPECLAGGLSAKNNREIGELYT